jgi:hypothetical protein
MPYIKNSERKQYDKILDGFNDIEIKTKGDLEYCIFTLMLYYMRTRESKYSQLHDCTYAAQHCSDEFRRRFLDKREDSAKETNGDISIL